MLSTILFLIYILSIITVIFIERKNPTEALLWVLIMICIPYVGTLLYLIFGDTITIKLTSFFRLRRLKQIDKEVLKEIIVKADELSSSDKQVMQFNSVYNKSNVTCYDDVKVYTCGKDHYKQLFEDIANAKKSIYVEFYTIHNDIIGQKFVEALAKKAKEGVEVLVMMDFIANIATPKKMFKPLISEGGKVIRLKPYLTHYRSHRKIVVIDHEISYIGGMNIGKQYANLAKIKNPWRDTQVRLTGMCANELENYFFTDWLVAIRKKDVESFKNKIKFRKPIKYNETNNLCQFIVGGVDNSRESVKMVYLSMIRSAKKTIRIQSPYFIPDASILDALKVAIASGVKVELMIPGIKASFFLDPVTTYYSGQLLKYGAKVYKYNGYIHAKTMIIDDEVCAIGSVNMDVRSLMVDDEVCGVFYHNDLVGHYSKVYDNDINSCKNYTVEQFDNRTIGEKIQEGFFLLFAPLM